MLSVCDVIRYIESIAPAENAVDYDNIGLMIGKRETVVTGILCCLDLTGDILDEAVRENFNTIITHHPVIFDPVRKLDEDNPRGVLLCSAIRNNLSVYSAHTNWDFAQNGVNDALCAVLMLKNIKADASKEHRYGELESEISVYDFIDFVKEKLDSRGLKYIIPEACRGKMVKKAGISCGSFDNEHEWIYENGVDVLVTGEIKHSAAIVLNMHGFVTIAAGHYESEIWGMYAMTDMLAKKFGKHTKVRNAESQKNPFEF